MNDISNTKTYQLAADNIPGAAMAQEASCDAVLAADSERLLVRASNLARTWINAADPNVRSSTN